MHAVPLLGYPPQPFYPLSPSTCALPYSNLSLTISALCLPSTTTKTRAIQLITSSRLALSRPRDRCSRSKAPKTQINESRSAATSRGAHTQGETATQGVGNEQTRTKNEGEKRKKQRGERENETGTWKRESKRKRDGKRERDEGTKDDEKTKVRTIE